MRSPRILVELAMSLSGRFINARCSRIQALGSAVAQAMQMRALSYHINAIAARPGGLLRGHGLKKSLRISAVQSVAASGRFINARCSRIQALGLAVVQTMQMRARSDLINAMAARCRGLVNGHGRKKSSRISAGQSVMARGQVMHGRRERNGPLQDR